MSNITKERICVKAKPGTCSSDCIKDGIILALQEFTIVEVEYNGSIFTIYPSKIMALATSTENVKND